MAVDPTIYRQILNNGQTEYQSLLVYNFIVLHYIHLVSDQILYLPQFVSRELLILLQ